MRIVVVIPIYNGLADTLACLESLFQFEPHAEVVVADDASTDDSPSRIRAAYSNVEVVSLPENRGFGAASNAGLARAFAKGADAAFLVNNDTLVTHGMLETLVECLKAHPNAGLVAPMILAHPSGEVWSAGGVCRLEDGSSENLVVRASDKPYETDWLTGCAYLMTRETFERVGGFDESLHMYVEDLDLSLRIRQAGFRLIVEPRATLHHKVSQTFSLMSPVKHYYKIRNLLAVMRRNLEAAEFKRARARLIRRAWERLVKDTARRGWLGIQRFAAVRRAVRDEASGRMGRAD